MEELDITIDDLSNLTYSFSSTETHQKVAQAIQNQWYEVLGVFVNLEKLEIKTLLEKLSKRSLLLLKRSGMRNTTILSIFWSAFRSKKT